MFAWWCSRKSIATTVKVLLLSRLSTLRSAHAHFKSSRVSHARRITPKTVRTSYLPHMRKWVGDNLHPSSSTTISSSFFIHIIHPFSESPVKAAFKAFDRASPRRASLGAPHGRYVGHQQTHAWRASSLDLIRRDAVSRWSQETSPLDAPELLGGWPTPLKNMSQWEGLSHILWKNRSCSKPPTSEY